jgi:hypothetical protein
MTGLSPRTPADVAPGAASLGGTKIYIVNPVFGYSSPEVPEWLGGLSGDDEEIVTVLRGIIAEVAPDAHEIIYRRCAI